MSRLLLRCIFMSGWMFCSGACPAQQADNPLGLAPHHITASVVDLGRAVQWYEKVLGFRLNKRGSHGAVQFAELSIPGFGVALVKFPGVAADGARQRDRVPSWIHIVFSVPDVDRTFRQLKSRGAAVATRDNPDAGPVSSFTVTDSEGNEIEILSAKG